MAKTRVDLILGAKDQTKQAFASVNKGVGKFNIGQAAMASGAVAVAAAIVAASKAVVELIGNMAKLGDEMDKASKRTGLAVESLDRWNYVAQLGGSSASEFEAGVKRLQRSLYDAGRGSAEASEAFKRLGIETHNADGTLRDADSVMYDIADAMAGMSSDSERAALAQVLLGRGGTQLIPVLKQGSEAIREQMAELEKLGGVMGEGMAESSAKLVDAQLRIKIAWRNVQLALAEPFMEDAEGGVNLIAEALGELVVTIRDNSEELRIFAEDMMKATDAAIKLVAAIVKFNNSDMGKFLKFANSFVNPVARAESVISGVISIRNRHNGSDGGAQPAAEPYVFGSGGDMIERPLLPGLKTPEQLAEVAAVRRASRIASFEASNTGGNWSSISASPVAMAPGVDSGINALNPYAIGAAPNAGAPEDALLSSPLFSDEDLAELADASQTIQDEMDAIAEKTRQTAEASAAAMGEFLGSLISGAASAEDAVKRLIVQLLAMQVASIGGPVGSLLGGVLGGLRFERGGTIPAAAAGMTVTGGARGLDSRLIRAMPGEEVIRRDRADRWDRILSSLEAAPMLQAAGGGGGVINQHFAFPNTLSDLRRIGNETSAAQRRSTL